MDAYHPVGDENPFDSHGRVRTATFENIAMIFPELEHQQMHNILALLHKPDLLNFKRLRTLLTLQTAHMTKLTQWLIKTESIH